MIETFVFLLTGFFIVLKLTGHFKWHWGWVFSPIIFTITVYAAIIAAAMEMAGVK